MKLLSELLYKTGIEEVKGNINLAITSICFDSRKVIRDSLFIATRGTTVDGHTFIDKTIEEGAVAIICEEFPDEILERMTYVKVTSSSKALGIIAANFYDNPSENLKLIGITGTNGKTTTATLLYLLFRGLGKKVGLLSTVKNRILGETIPSTHTTPDAIAINELLAEMVAKGCNYCFMEVSSHAIHQNRIAGLAFDLALFTNITHDHLDYHNTFDEYIKAKKKFFDDLPSFTKAITNADERHGNTMVLNTKAEVKKYGLKAMADYKCRLVENSFEGLQLSIDGQDVWTRLVGSFNAYNLLSVYATAVELGEDKIEVLTSLSSLPAVEGRFQHFKSKVGIVAIIDYAHTPDALKKVLNTIKDIRSGNEELITVVGCGGDRDTAKRPLMARIAANLSDRVIVTSDNPRSENPEAIINEMKMGLDPVELGKMLAITDRGEAIKTACVLAKPGDIIIVAGKGHEKYQEISGVKHPFDDLEMLEDSFKILEK
ncbi:MAG: UDP-N-acetylmuramoyl-L-alanyl-D-glutamate--2,6-diaminopimelate ligase [Flavobacteriales bacterium]|jgi:UDP-N-acetylmuramoyl-L-alanyl-D-glutamate--2,6-diaminopimelate ligase|tara:strand:+ start:4793 stop:6256 length:1464 start_codon:yes stop_codon:yes gene_type:complete